MAYYEDNRPTEGMLAEQRQAALDAAAAAGQPPPAPSAVPASIADAGGHLHPSSPDVVEILAFSCIMLNTDAHNASIKREKKMTRKQFVSNNRCGVAGGHTPHCIVSKCSREGLGSTRLCAVLPRRGIDRGADLPRAFLEYLYDSIVGDEIRMQKPHAGAAGGSGQAPGSATTVSAAAAALLLPPASSGACRVLCLRVSTPSTAFPVSPAPPQRQATQRRRLSPPCRRSPVPTSLTAT